MPARPTVAYVHGVGLDHSLWDEVRAQGDAPPSFTYDLLGHGMNSDVRPRNLADFVAQLDTELDSAGLGVVDLVGFSLGALVAQGFAAAEPHRVRRLVLVNPVFDRTPEERAAIVERVGVVRAGGYAASVDQALSRWFSPAVVQRCGPRIEAIRRQMLANDVEAYADAYYVFATGDAELVSTPPLIAAPTLVVTGSDDPRSTPAMALALAQALPSGQARIIRGARHMTPVETPGTLGVLISRFLEESP